MYNIVENRIQLHSVTRLVTLLTQSCPLTTETLGNQGAPDWLKATVTILTRGNFSLSHTTATVGVPKTYRCAWSLHKVVAALWAQPPCHCRNW